MRVMDRSLIIVGGDAISESGISIQNSSYSASISPLLTLSSDNHSLRKPAWENQHSVFCIRRVRMCHLGSEFFFHYVIQR